MSSSDFLKEMFEIDQEFSDSSGESQDFISEILIQFGFHAYPEDQTEPLKYWKVCPNKAEAAAVKAEIQQRMAHNKESGKIRMSMRVWTGKENLNRDDGLYESNKFYPLWTCHKDKPDDPDTAGSLITDSVEANNLPVGRKFWGRYQLKSNPWHVSRGEEGKTKTGKDGTKYFPTFPLPLQAYASKEAAQAAANEAGLDNSDQNGFAWSQKVKEAYGDNVVGLETQADDIRDQVQAVLRGENPMGNNYPIAPQYKPAEEDTDQEKEAKARAYIANCWQIEPSDIDILLDQVIPF